MPRHPLFSVKNIRAIETAALAALPPFSLMQAAGDAAARAAIHMLEHGRIAHAVRPAGKPDPKAGTESGAQTTIKAVRILVLAGPGNNGGDALVAATALASQGHRPTIAFFGDESRLPADARTAFERAQSAGIEFVRHPASLPVSTHGAWDLVIDGLFGIGLKRPIDDTLRGLVAEVNALACPVLALDVPSGLDSDTGQVVGAGIAVKATRTLTFIADKPGLHTGVGRDHAGQVDVVSLDISPDLFPGSQIFLTQPDDFRSCLRPRSHASHKGSHGDVVLFGGAAGMTGALVLASRAAAHCGAGRVLAAFLENPPSHDPLQPEIMCRLAEEMTWNQGAIVIGPGLGSSAKAKTLLARVLAAGLPLVIDADALNLIAAHPDLQDMLSARGSPAILTPHPLEAARLSGCATSAIQADRLEAARALARRFASHVILKGSGSIIASPDEEAMINPTGNPALATGGSGDVLAGVAGALLAQGWSPREAAIGAAWMHGEAADRLVAAGTGPIGLVAGELIPAMRAVLNQLVSLHASAPHESPFKQSRIA
jgi:ADP-dependent NAD(P)H-hydrate dehydratase / NAD(P)H-hydrate epimerase